MSESGGEIGPVIVALAVGDVVLADRLAALLADVPGLRLASAGEPADVRLVGPESDTLDLLEQPLTPREAQVLRLLAEGASNKAIARALGISVHTAKFHVGQLLDKLDAPAAPTRSRRQHGSACCTSETHDRG